jgi:hypothetical protein
VGVRGAEVLSSRSVLSPHTEVTPDSGSWHGRLYPAMQTNSHGSRNRPDVTRAEKSEETLQRLKNPIIITNLHGSVTSEQLADNSYKLLP